MKLRVLPTRACWCLLCCFGLMAVGGLRAQTYDLALRKTTTQTTVVAGQTITFSIEVFNQGDAPVRNVVVADFLPDATSFNNVWTPVGNYAINTIPGPLPPGGKAVVEIELFVQSNMPPGMDFNVAEILSAEDMNGNPVTDSDGTFDDDPDNDPVIDDLLSGDGTDDEDNHDVASFTVIACDLSIAGVSTSNGGACAGEAFISIAALGGTGDYEYSIDGGQTFQSTNLFDNLISGVYQVQVRDSNGACAVDGTAFSLAAPADPVINNVATTAPGSCTFSNGDINIDASGDGPLEYSIDGGQTFQGTGLFQSLPNGTYQPVVRYTNGQCRVAGNAVELLATDGPMIANVDLTDPTFCTGQNGAINIGATGGPQTLQYSIDGGLTFSGGSFFVGLSGGVYDIVVRYADGSCPVAAGAFTLAGGGAPTINDVVLSNTTGCNVATGQLSISATTAAGGLEYSVDGGQTYLANGGTFTGLPAGAYAPRVRYTDGSCAVAAADVTILDGGQAPAIDMIFTGRVSSCAATDGQLTVLAVNSSADLEYSIDGGATYQFDNVFNGVASGTYSVLVRNGTAGCTSAPTLATVGNTDAPAITNIDLTNTSNCDEDDGSINIIATGGLPVEYSIDGGNFYQTGGLFSGLAAGNYAISVRFVGGDCVTDGGTVTLTQPAAPVIANVQKTDPTDCATANGTITFNATGDDLEYSIDGGLTYLPTATFINLNPGTYHVSVRHNNGNCATDGGTVTLVTADQVNITNIASADPSTCTGTDGEINIQAFGNNVEFSINGGASYQANGLFTGLAGGIYNVRVRKTDVTCVTSGGSIVLLGGNEPVIDDVFTQNITDCNGTNGIITVLAGNDNGDFEYSIDGGITYQDGPAFSGLPSGSYNIAVRKADGSCAIGYDSNPVELTEPPAPVIDDVVADSPTDCGLTNGSISIFASGGIGFFVFSIDGGQTFNSNPLFQNLAPGSYDIVIQNGDFTCRTSGGTAVVEALEDPMITGVDVTPPSGCDSNDAGITINATGGSFPLEYSIDGGQTWQTSNIYADLPQATYAVAVRYNNGNCVVLGDDIVIRSTDSPIITDVVPVDPTFCDSEDGTVTFALDLSQGNMAEDYDYSIDGGITFQNNNAFGNLSPGTYNTVVRNLDGTCAVNGPTIILTAPDQPVLSSVDFVDPSGCNTNDGTITINITGGNTPEFSIDGGMTYVAGPVFSDLPAGMYTPAVRNADGRCESIGTTVMLTGDQPIIADVFSQNPSDCGADDGLITVQSPNDDGTFAFSVDGGAIFQNSNEFTGLGAGTYTIVVQTADGSCQTSGTPNGTVVLTEPAAPTITDVQVSQPNCNNNNGNILILATGGSGTLEYTIDGTAWVFGNNFPDLAPGTYSASVRNAGGGCAQPAQTIVLANDPGPFVNGTSATDATDCDQPDGAVAVDAFACVGNSLEYSIDGGASYQTSATFDGLPPGTYDVLVRYAGQTNTVSAGTATVGGPVSPQLVTVQQAAPSGCGTNDGQITITATGGNGPLEYSLDGFTWVANNGSFSGLDDGSYAPQVRNADGSCVTLAAPISFNACCQLEVVLTDAGFGVVEVGVRALANFADNTINSALITVVVPTQTFNIDNVTNLQAGVTFDDNFRVNAPQESPGFDYIVFELENGPTTGIALDNGTVTPLFSFTNEDICAGVGGSIAIYNNETDPLQNPNSANVVVGNRFDNPQLGAGDVCDNGGAFSFDGVNLSLDATATDATTCDNPDGTITATATGGSGAYGYSIDGGMTFQVSNTFTSVGPGQYQVLVRDASYQCEVSFAGNPLVVTAPNAPMISDASGTDPNCGATDGSIVITATGNNLNYSINGGANFQTAATFTGLAAGMYATTVRDVATGCESAGPVITLVDQAPEIAEVQTTDASTCQSADGTITVLVNNPGGQTLEYSVDGTTFQQNNFFAGLTAATYTVTLRVVGTACSISSDPVVINGSDGPMATFATTNNGCGQTGSIVFTPTGASSYVYSIDGGANFQAAPEFFGLAAGTYPLQVRFDDGSCATDVGTATVLDVDFPTFDNVGFTDLTDCVNPNGTITATATGDTDLEYVLSSNGTVVSSNTTGTFTGLAAGVYSLAVRYLDGSCSVDYVTTITLSNPIDAPVIDGIDVTLPANCAAVDGGIVVNASGNGDPLEYSLDGQNYQAGNIFNQLAAQTYTVSVRYVNGSCVTTATADLGNADAPCTETVSVTINEPTNFCIDPVFLQPGGQIFSASFCDAGDPATVQASNLMDNCLDLTPADGYEGTIPVPICVIHCFDAAGTLCDTTFISVTVTAPCPDLFPEQLNFVENPDNTICLDVPLDQSTAYDILLNGIPYTQALEPCNLIQQNYYSYALVPGGANDGPYDVSWTVDGAAVSGVVLNSAELAQFLNDADPTADDWTDTPSVNVVRGGNAATDYGSLVLTQQSSGVGATLMLNTTPIALGTQLTLPGSGTFSLQYTDPATGCEDQTIITVGPVPITTDTVFLTTVLDTPSDQVCVDGSQLPGGTVVNFGYCDFPTNGGAVAVSPLCVQYFPNQGFLGTDSFCLLACDGGDPQVCDTTYVFVTVTPPTESFVLDIPAFDPVDTCLTDYIQLPTFNAGTICGSNPSELDVTINGECVTIDPVGSFSGTSEVCIVYCDDNNLCDTTLITVNVDSPCDPLFTTNSTIIGSSFGAAFFCLPFTAAEIGNPYEVLLDGSAYDGPVDACANGNAEIFISGNGLHQLILNGDFGCSDTLDIEIIFEESDTTYLSTPMNTPILEVCFDDYELPGGFINTLGYCIVPPNAQVPIVNDSCVAFLPDQGFAGQQTFCLVVCDTFVPTNCDTAYYVVNVLPMIDTVEVVTTDIDPFDFCLPGNALQASGDIVDAFACGPNDGVTITFGQDSCLTVDLDNDYTGGIVEACVVHCYDFNPGICDTTLLLISSEMPCPALFDDEVVNVVGSSDTTTYCVALSPDALEDFNVTLDGAVLSGPYAGCQNDSVTQYIYTLLPQPGPYTLTWMVGNNTFLGDALDVAGIVAFMNANDPDGDWTFDAANSVISSSNDPSGYGSLNILQTLTTINTTLDPNFNLISAGTEFTITGFGEHELVITDPITGCEDILEVHIFDQDNTIEIVTPQDTPSDVVCLDTDDLNGDLVSIEFCEAPQNGTIEFVNLNCIEYTPDPGYFGFDDACIVICDNTGACDTTFVLVTVEQVCPVLFADNSISIIADDCVNQTDIAVCLPLGPASFDQYTVTDNGQPYAGSVGGCELDSMVLFNYTIVTGVFQQGPYGVTFIVNGESFTDTVQNSAELVDRLNVWDPGANWMDGPQAFTLTGGHPANDYGILTVNSLSTGIVSNLMAQVVIMATQTEIRLTPGSHELVFTNNFNGCAETLTVDIICDTDGCLELFATSDNELDIADCTGTAAFCVSVPLDSLVNYAITLNGTVFDGPTGVCADNANQAAVFLPVGNHELIFTQQEGACADTFNVEVSCTGLFEDTVVDTFIRIDEVTTFCLLDFNVNPTDVVSVTNTCPDLSGDNLLYELVDTADWCFTLTPLALGFDTLCLEVCTMDTCIDLTINVEVVPACTPLFETAVFGGGLLDCAADGGPLCLPVSLSALSDVDIFVDDALYTDSREACAIDSIFSIKYNSLPDMGDNGPYRINSFVINGQDFTSDSLATIADLVDALNAFDPTGNWELDTDNRCINGGTSANDYGLLLVEQIETGATGSLGVNQLLVPRGVQLFLPAGTSTLVFVNTTNGCTDTLTATLACVESDVLEIDILVGESDTLCFATDELPAGFDNLQLACNEDVGEFAFVEALADTSCITVFGLDAGTEALCVLVCDSLGVCDTTFLTINVIQDLEPPVAVNDTVTTAQDEVLIINIFGNDIIPGNIDTTYFLLPPSNGTVGFLPDLSVTYVPNEGFCSEEPDMFQYVVCNAVGCDTATVFVTVECTEFRVFTGFSPNDDGINDAFVIQGLQLFPDHELFVYNRWGNLVFQTQDYQSDWQGTWNGNDLPDGTYFYVLDLGEGEEPVKGYVQLHR